MPSTYTPNNGIEIIATGEQSGTWGDTTNTNLELIDVALDGQLIKTLAVPGISSSPNALAITDGDQSDGRNRLIIFTDGGDLGSTAYVQLTPNDAEKIIYVRNDLAGGRSIIFFQGTYNASNDFELPAGKDAIVKFNGGGSGAITSAVFEDLYLGNATVVTLVNTNIQVSNIAALDGTSAGSIADSTGVVTLASSVLTTADINGGTLDNVTIGGDTPAAATFTTATATNVQVTNIKANDGTSAMTVADSTGVVTIPSAVSTNVQVTNIKANDGTSAMTIADSTGIVTFAAGTTGTTQTLTTIDVTNINAHDGTASAIIADATGVMTIASSVLTTTDINGGTIDGTVIGGSTPAAITGTTITGTSFVTTGDMTFGDNDKAIFGAGSDLQIFHSGSHSIITDTGTGDLKILGQNVEIGATSGELNFKSIAGAQAQIYYNNSPKLATTATGIDVTGTVTADGLAVDGTEATFGGASGEYKIVIEGSAAPRQNYIGMTGYDSLVIAADEDNLGGASDIQFRVDAKQVAAFSEGGDISFYEDTGTTPKFFWDASAESLGIGTSSPAYRLDVSSIGGSIARFINGSSGGTPSTTHGEIIVESGEANMGLQLLGTSTSNQKILFADPDSAGAGQIVYDHSSNYMALFASATERLRIDSSGNVGIGTNSPQAPLNVYGSDGIVLNLTNTSWKTAQIKPIDEGGSFKGSLAFFTHPTNGSPTTPVERLRITSTGSVGIGTSSPAYNFVVSAAGASGIEFGPAYSGTANLVQHYSRSGGVYVDAVNEAAQHRFNISGTERLRIDSSGNVGIGTSSPAAKLHIEDDAGSAFRVENITNTSFASSLFVDDTGAGLTITNYGSAYASGSLLSVGAGGVALSSTTDMAINVSGAKTLRFGTNSTERARIDASGNLLVNRTSTSYSGQMAVQKNSGGYVFESHRTGTGSEGHTVFINGNGAVGSIFTNGTATSYNTSSDYRLKEDVQPMSGAFDRVLALNPVNFAWKADGTRVDGFLAHEAQAVVPAAVTGEKDGEEMQAIDHSKLVPLLTAALQEALTKIEALEARITALEA
jgi:hypothetical protein